MADEGVIKIKGDIKDLEAKLNAAKVKLQELGGHAERAAGHSKSFGEAWEHANSRMARTVLHAISIGGAIHHATEAMEEFQKKSEEASENLDKIRVQREKIAATLGAPVALVEGATTGASPLAMSARTAFAQHLADKETVGRQNRKLTSAEFTQSNALFSSGFFDEKQIEYALDKGKLGTLSTGRAYAAMSPENRAAYDAQVRIQGLKDQAEEAREGQGRKFRLNAADYDAQLARGQAAGNPLAFLGDNPLSNIAAKFGGGRSNPNTGATDASTPLGRLALQTALYGPLAGVLFGIKENTTPTTPPPTLPAPAK